MDDCDFMHLFYTLFPLHDFYDLKIMSNIRPNKCKIKTSFRFRFILCYLMKNGTIPDFVIKSSP